MSLLTVRRWTLTLLVGVIAITGFTTSTASGATPAERQARAVAAARAKALQKATAKAQAVKKAGQLQLAGTKKANQRKEPNPPLPAQILFVLLSGLCVCFSLVMITRKSPLMAAMSLLVVFLCLAGIYLYLQAPFMAAMQLIVYAGAVIVLFVFVILSMGLNEEKSIRNLGSEIAIFAGGLTLCGAAAWIFHFNQNASPMWMPIAGFALLEAMVFAWFVLYLRYPLTRFLGVAASSFAMVQVMRLATIDSATFLGSKGIVAGKSTLVLSSGTHTGFGEARSLGKVIFTDHIFAFEALSLLLLAAVVAAVVIVRSSKEEQA